MAQKKTNEPHYDLVREIKTGRVFLAEYSREAAEWYEKGTGNAYPLHGIEILPTIKGWVARDKNGFVFFHREKPHRELDCVWRTAWVMHPRPELDHLRLPNALDIQGLNWESEPVEVELLIRKV